MDGGKHCVFFAVGDFDRDSDLDFAVTHWTEDFATVFVNDGSGNFPSPATYKTGLGNYGVVTLDANGDGVPQDDKEALRWFRLAADQGHDTAQYSLGLMYADGRGVPLKETEPMIITKKCLPRRTFIRGTGTALALPLLDSMVPALSAMAKTSANPVRRLGFI